MGGFSWITVRGVRVSSKEAPILAVAPHSSFFDSLALVYMDLTSVVAKTESKHIPCFGSRLFSCSSVPFFFFFPSSPPTPPTLFSCSFVPFFFFSFPSSPPPPPPTLFWWTGLFSFFFFFFLSFCALRFVFDELNIYFDHIIIFIMSSSVDGDFVNEDCLVVYIYIFENYTCRFCFMHLFLIIIILRTCVTPTPNPVLLIVLGKVKLMIFFFFFFDQCLLGTGGKNK